ncbi:endoribonuclease L-PSP [Syntrophotalea carbinolica DSM 2380]|uniref:Endoribonuclease L-PSP n=1 Tax=Syntrophotalea carbinolica (strain DSM 2380 / NBRC 103641 / GraBd1) TaxID=338963 RepID=Q3A520_SYNC1|nr:RidA family protein [Syntrophotalea carbinolica]ABA88537.1 endoribonuclease L-PSP [Syntrophotalea carbinolica DSM 2380]
MPIEKITTEQAPAAIGPYSQAVRAGDYLFFSGQIPLDPATGNMVGKDAESQTLQVVSNIKAVLAAAGLGVNDVVKTTVYLTDLQDFEVVNRVYAECFGSAAPARATVQVAALPKGALVEIEGVAYAGD